MNLFTRQRQPRGCREQTMVAGEVGVGRDGLGV